MKQKKVIFSILASAVLLSACQSKTSHTGEAAATDTIASTQPAQPASFNGTYEGTLPCADCEGIRTTLTLRADSTYDLKSEYLGKEDGVFETSGVYHAPDGKLIELVTPSSGEKTYYKVLDEASVMLSDSLGTENQGELAPHYVLKKK